MPPLARRLLIVFAAATAVAAVVITGLWMSGRFADHTSTTEDASATPPPAGSVSGPVDGSTAITVVEPGPAQPVATDAAPVTAGGAVDVVVTYADWDASSGVLEVSGFVSGAVEEDGTCRVTARSEGRTATAERVGIADATTTSCGTLVIPRSDVSPGTWDVVLSYESPTSSGRSTSNSVSVTA
jgi:hypothetical protein